MTGRIRRWARRAVATLVLAGLLGGGGLWFWLDRTLPATSGEFRVPGLPSPISITRDAYDVPTIRAETDSGAWFALGFVHAQDRLYQMDLQRRLGAGRLAEIFGSSMVTLDRQMRILGLALAAQRETQRDGEFSSVLSAYTRGVNAWLGTHPHLPVEFTLLGYRPEPWTPVDSLIIGKLTQLELGGDFRGQLLRARLSAKLTPDQLAELLPGHQATAQPVPEDLVDIFRQLPLDRMLRALPPMIGPAPIARDWAVDGKHSATGKPLLAENPPLDPAAPGMWYLARLEAPGLDIAGASLAGSPVIRLGHNARIAWGASPFGESGVQLFVERIDPADAGRYQTPKGSLAFTERQEIITIRGAPDQQITIRETRHGPVISDAVGSVSERYVLALQANFLSPANSEQAQWRIGLAGDWNGFTLAEDSSHAPRLDMVYADVEDNVGMCEAGDLPLRSPSDGDLPVPGWADDQGGPIWASPPDPRCYSGNGHIATGSGDTETPPAVASDPAPPEGIDGSVPGDAKSSVSASAALMHDTLSPTAQRLLQLMLAVPPVGDRQKQAYALLRRWDGRMDEDQPEPLIFTTWLNALDKRIYADELGELYPDLVRSNPLFVEAVLTKYPRWCDDVSTPEIETCDTQISAALDDAIRGLRRRLGNDMTSWRRSASTRLQRLRPALRWLGAMRSLMTEWLVPSDRQELRDEAGRRALARLNIAGAGMRAIYDLSDLDRSVFMISPGESTNPLSPHYDDLAPLWRGFDWIRLPREPKGATLRLVPPA